MCRYAMIKYKQHYACFSCRKSFKRRLLQDVNRGGPDRPYRCPQCSQEMANMGLDFAAPKKTDTKAWKTLESLYEIGVTFHSCGCSGPGYRPRNPKALLEFLQQRLQEYEKQALLVEERPLVPPAPSEDAPKGRWRKPRWRRMDKAEARAFWNKKTAEIRRALQKQRSNL